MSGLALAVTLARRRVNDRALQVVDGVAGAGITAFGGVLAYRTVADS